MKDFMKVFLLILGGIAFYLGLSLLAGVNLFLIAMIRIVVGAGIIIGGIMILRKNKKWTHRLPRDKEKEHEKEYKKQFKKD